MSGLLAGAARIGLGCMRLSSEPGRDEARGLATVHAALEAGVRIFDTARAYGLHDADRGHNERLLARALASHPAGAAARVVTKGGMARPDGAWRPDGRASALRADCEASRAALGGRAIDLYLLHAPDPRTPWATSVRALRGLLDEKMVGAIGVSNVNRRQLEEALDLAPIAAVELALGADDVALRGGVVQRALERGLWVLAHAPFGGRAAWRGWGATGGSPGWPRGSTRRRPSSSWPGCSRSTRASSPCPARGGPRARGAAPGRCSSGSTTRRAPRSPRASGGSTGRRRRPRARAR
jgi:aryl-alcohol dehydrogenase-like predicted oxidoreductase